MIDHRTTRPPRSPRPAVAAVALLLAGAAALVVAAALGLWVSDQVLSTRLWRVESVVAPVVVAVGVVAATWVGASALVAGTCAAVRTAGGAWRAGELVVQRWAPGLVRRALAVAVAAGVGLGAAAGAHAAVEIPPAPPAATVDLGWTPTADLTATGERGTTAPAVATTDPGGVTLADDTFLGTTEGTAAAVPSVTTAAPAPPDQPATATAAPPAAVAPAALPPAAAAPAAVPPPAVTPVAVPVAAPAASGTPAPLDGTVQVQPGDTLWGIAARSLGADASDAAIAAEWPRWYAANAATIGPDPDVLRPGQVLVVPTADGGTR